MRFSVCFNSLDAQRESGEAYVRSRVGEGWTLLPDQYDDGGYTGANMERPELKRLLADSKARRVDCVVVYKVDRLSRSIRDFFEKHGTNFVSVTQQFNTTTSLGRLTLNILLSFAQFEREIISERTRDKQVATRKRGKWTGGHLTLGYDLDAGGGRLVLNQEEAECVRQLFEGSSGRATHVRPVRPSIALRRPLVFCATCGVTFIPRISCTKSRVWIRRGCMSLVRALLPAEARIRIRRPLGILFFPEALLPSPRLH